MSSNNSLLLLGTAVLVIFGVGYSINKEQQMGKLAKTVGLTVKELQDANDIEIRDAVVNKAITESVNRKVGSYMSSLSHDIYQDAEKTLKDHVSSIVNDEVGRIRSSVRDKIYNQVNHVDISSIKRSIENSVKEKILEKLDNKLDELVDDITEDYNDRHKVYVIRR